ncbi:hypothetical protein MB02_07285 [Croceicoccus estronivorus]|uniref:acyclic terpene utilization AtuA family protein n=1 Tax=Croceicoccus estronivorus TaxID=1172626 RepID=UPI00082BD9E5|nr:acyclic terpene utilization AtuA family protein [Croceicoccus estronivorus]OCC24378.1 hypothetical protein MB02_07285 [Croceicoccus estronivorus]
MSHKNGQKVVKIGGASGALNDSVIAVPQLLRVPGMNYLAFDYLGEGAMGLMRRLKEADPRSGFLPDFVNLHIGPYLSELKSRGIKVISNAGGLNPEGLAEMIRQRGREINLDIKVAVVTGDDLDELVPELRENGTCEMFGGEPFPDGPIGSINAYLGAFPIAAALDAGADMVITGRVVDSALILGPLIHEFGWQPDDFDLLAAGSAAGHLLECGTQVTGGTFTDWQDVPDWANIGFPVGECHADGTCVITKPDETGGLVSVGTVAEQLLYEVSDPQAYMLPDVVCDFSTVKLEQIGENRVRVSGAKGHPPTDQYKVCVTYDAGWRSVALIPIVGIDAAAKARRTGEALLERTSNILRNQNQPDWQLTHVEVIGAEASYGDKARPLNPREVLLKIVVDHEDPACAAMFGREQSTAIMNMAVGTSIAPIVAAPRAFPLTEMFLFLIGKDRVQTHVTLDGKPIPFEEADVAGFNPDSIERPATSATAESADTEVPLIDLAWARSGDKGRLFNVGVIARKPEYLPYIRASLTEQAVADWYREQFDNPGKGRVDAYDVPGCHALNFVVHDAQGGGINMSPRFDAAAKTMGQHLLEMPVKVPVDLARSLAG